jgi:hypothetical protein
MENLAAISYFANFALSATATFLAFKLFRRYRHCGWLMLGVAFLSPFGFLLLRLLHGRPLLTFRSYGPAVNGVAQLTYRVEIPWFYMVVVAGLLSLYRDARSNKQA